MGGGMSGAGDAELDEAERERAGLDGAAITGEPAVG
jgi:hypothetical protein